MPGDPIPLGGNHDPLVLQWATRISEAWQDTVAGILKVGKMLADAHRELEAREQEVGGTLGLFGQLVGREPHPQILPFGYRTSYRLMRIAQDERLVTHVSQMPPSWGTLHQLTRLSDDTFDRMLADGTIRPDMERNEVNRVLRMERVQADEARVLNLRPRPGIFRTLVIDPAWEYDWLSLAGRAKPGYAMQSLDQLRELDLTQWCDEEAGTHLYCWVTNNFMYEAGKLVAGWGFQHRCILTWVKPPPFGLGSYFRNSTEHVIFATRGDTTTRPAAASISTDFEAPRGDHSEKPEKFYDIVRAASYPPYGEGNQREPREDFTNLFEDVAVAEGPAQEHEALTAAE